MIIRYNDKTDLLYVRLDSTEQYVINKRITKIFFLDIGENDKIIGIEIMDASKHINLEKLMPIEYHKSA